MKIYSTSIINGHLEDRFGNRGSQFLNGKKASRSFQLSWDNLPEGTKSLALIFIDYDAIPVCGFSWIHWTAANIDPNIKELPENASIDMDLLQGLTSWYSKFLPNDWRLSKEEAIGYGGCAPPDKPHQYTIKLYALSKVLDLKSGFYANELLKAMDGYILGKAKITAIY